MKLKCLECDATAEYVHVHQGFGGSYCKKHYEAFLKIIREREAVQEAIHMEYLQKVFEQE